MLTRVLLIGLCIFVFIGPWLPGDSPQTTRLDAVYQPPSMAHGFGTDALGRDMLARTMYGGRQTVLLSLFAASMGLGCGIGLGMMRAFSDGVWRIGVMALETALLSTPAWLIALVCLAGFGASHRGIIIGVGLTQIGGVMRMTAGWAEHIRRSGFYQASVACGANLWHLVGRVVIPNIMPLVWSQACLVLSAAATFVSGLTFLGLGGTLGEPEWGAMLAEGRASLRYAPWVVLVPACCLMLWIGCLNALSRQLNRRRWSF